MNYNLYIWEVFCGEDSEGGTTLCRSQTLKTSAEFLIREFQRPCNSRYETGYLKAIEELREILESPEAEGEVEYLWKFGSVGYILQRVGIDD